MDFTGVAGVESSVKRFFDVKPDLVVAVCL